ncbi:MarR family winged helix-turn-helix transcriptional regulator [Amycolatopsis sp. 195334CR]|uniref:MarR family winged helix-turn-helix transcriptional regulator n=1 Tax=Amycolatopsis sp. 195334CR TaxID=2814588 RepID=UPI001A8C78B5|nr:MarR family transcriptional regulator [Amycolatopsis sp. 195334CR]MBN6039172.1 MarR family transcriptional regulator [Amycolatopsis sp. 195334CR]
MKGAELGRELSTAVVAFHEAIGARLGVSAVDQRAYALIGKLGPLSAGALAKEIGLTPGAVTGMVDRLERAGLVHRTPDPDDRRRVVISTAGGGARVFGAAFAGLGGAMEELISGYREEEQRAIEDYVRRTVDILREQTRKLASGQDT